MDQALRQEQADTERLADPDRSSLPTPAARPALLVDDLSLAFGAIRAVDSVSFSAAPGEIVALVGHSGSGKSTLLRLIAGLDRPDAGRVVIDGREVSGPDAFVPPEARGIGMMFQDYALFPHLSVLKNVLFGLRRLRAEEAMARARTALDRVGLRHRENDFPHMLSGGEQQRVALARAMVPGPGLLMMDEPFSNLDRRTRDVIREETSGVLRESGTTTLVVTHDADDAMRIADRIMMMQGGRIVQSGNAEDLYKHPRSLQVARFFCELNEISGTCGNGVVSTPLGDVSAPEIAEGAAATVCLRPKEIRLFAPSPGDRTGTVISGQCLGDSVLVHLAVPELDRPLRVVVPATDAPAPGQTVGFAAGNVLVFPAN
ncbi:MAG: ABC transporter ATP-binding protein [Bauldia sp.]|uniref:ABC transporter ATP-binding protein n=1 Tax=Bauldia sp. TaxID=2575872 RepID=UPI001D831A8A|nr:ABC transporter ATP-binding protein [Bauldia sp.]MCB1495970.1 ABC transporter ATP-binding protein [Bauldia sp.]